MGEVPVLPCTVEVYGTALPPQEAEEVRTALWQRAAAYDFPRPLVPLNPVLASLARQGRLGPRPASVTSVPWEEPPMTRPFTIAYCAVCRQELTAITRCEKDGHRDHHDHCCPGKASSPAPARPSGVLGALRRRR